ncbi:hypothetical protein Tco_0861083 [Tanacetum coccineum]|uniref:Uncharacterized protein n=1 Tax=Tanacetum coccineum TaxID=301880 RepID=A0ABQ5BK64_9ASTR
MAVLESCPKHNMVAYLEKTDGNTEFHEIISFLTRSSIHYALIVSPVVSTTFVEQFWMSSKTKLINNVRYITAKVAGKPVSISEASIRSDLLFDDADGIDSLPNHAIIDAIKLMGFISVFLDKQLKNVPVPLDHFPINALTSKVFSFMVKKGKHFSGNVTHLFDSMLVQPTEDEGDTLRRQSEPQPIPSPPHLRGSGGNHGGQSSSDRSLSGNEGGMTLQSVYDLCISLCTQVTDQAKSVSMKQRLAGKKSLKKQWMQMEFVSKQGKKSAKAEPTVHKDPAFDELNDDVIDYMEIEDAQDVGRTRYVVHEEKESAETEVSTEDALNTAQPKVSTDKEEVSTDRPDEGTVDQIEGRSATQTALTTTPTIFGDDETIAQVLLNMSQAKAISKEKEKGVELKDVKNIERPRPTSTRSLLTLKPLPKIDPKDNGKKKIEEDESDIESEDINESEKKFKMLAHDEEIARKVQEDWEAEEVKKLAEEEAPNADLIQDFDDIKVRIEADRLLALTQRRFLAEQRVAAIRNRPPTRTQLRSQMMTYLKHVGDKKHSDLKNKTFEEIQALYEKVKRFDESFTVIGSTKDERKIKEMNKGASDLDKNKKFVKEDVSTKVPAKQDVAEQGTKKRKGGHMNMLARKRKRPQPDIDSDDEHRKCLKIVTFEGTIDSEIMERKSVIARLNKVSSPDGDYLVIYRANGNFRAINYLLEVLHIFDRQDLFHLYDLVMKQYSEVTLEGIELILWGDLKIMMESSTKENDQKLEDGTVIHMLVERSYPLSKDLLQRMLDFRLEVEIESTAALDLIRVLNSPCFMVMSWLVQDQTVLGKDYSNLLIADSLLKTIWFINAPCYGNKALASPKANELTIPEQMATGKGISNPFMAGSLPKTTKPTPSIRTTPGGGIRFLFIPSTLMSSVIKASLRNYVLFLFFSSVVIPKVASAGGGGSPSFLAWVDNKIQRIVASGDLHGFFLIRIDNIADLYDWQLISSEEDLMFITYPFKFHDLIIEFFLGHSSLWGSLGGVGENFEEVVRNYRFDETKEQKNETKGSESLLKNSTSWWRIIEDLVKDVKR